MSLIRETRDGDAIPYGPSIRRSSDMTTFDCYRWRFYVRLPLFMWYLTHRYHINVDAFVDGWFVLSALIVLERYDTHIGYGLKTHFAWVLRNRTAIRTI